jgi:uncharacterized membrane protein
MPALRRLSPAQGIAAMQSINKLAVTPAFMTVLFGSAVACLALIAWAAVSSGERPVALIVAAGAVYVVGTICMTIVRNVPLNDSLETLPPHAAEAEAQWDAYVTSWTAWNHVRTVAALGATAALTVALNL